MFENTRGARKLLAAGAGSTLSLGLAVVVGVIPQSGATTTSLQAAAVVPVAVTVPAVGEATATTLVAAASTTLPVPSTTEVPMTTVPAADVTAPLAPISSSASASAPALTPAPTSPAPVADPVEPAAPRVVPRRQPSSAEVDRALEGLRPYVRSIFSPGPAQVAEAGDKICTAFDEGQTVDEVTAAALALVKKVPFTTVGPGADEYVVRTAVALYCPGHASRLG